MKMSFEKNDITLIVGQGPKQRSYKCRRTILASQSDVFKAMFYGPLAERNDMVSLPYDDPEAFEKFINSVGEEKMALKSAEDTIELLYLADKYLISSVRRQCCTYLKQHITTRSVCSLLQVAQILQSHSLSYECWKYILFNANDILASTEFTDTPLEIAQSIILQDQLNVSSELQVYQACVNWSMKECSRRGKDCTVHNIREIIKPLLNIVRYTTMDYDEFIKGPFSEDILTEQEKCDIIKTMNASESCKKTRQILSMLDNPVFFPKCSCTDFHCHSELPFEIAETFISSNYDLYVYGISIRCVSQGFRAFYCSGTQTFGKLTIININRDYKVEKDIFLRTGAINFAEVDHPVYVKKGEGFEIILETKERVDFDYRRPNRDLNSLFRYRIPQYDGENFISTHFIPCVLKINVHSYKQ